jgi:ribulose-5-phosphate 4-epimerase/fuculose-1-phosphate aldolase
MASVEQSVSHSPSALNEARRDLAAAHRLAVMDDFHEGSWNHFSLMVPGSTTQMLITPGFTHFSEVTAGKLLELGPDLDAARQVDDATWVAYQIHYPIHVARPDAACVLHAHPPYATALATLKDGRVQMVEQNALHLYGRIAYTQEWDGAWPDDLEHGERLADALGDRNSILFLKHHGVVVVGRSVAAAYTDLYFLERTCRVQLIAMATNMPLALVPDELAAPYSAASYEDESSKRHHFAAMRRLLDQKEPDYRDL